MIKYSFDTEYNEENEYFYLPDSGRMVCHDYIKIKYEDYAGKHTLTLRKEVITRQDILDYCEEVIYEIYCCYGVPCFEGCDYLGNHECYIHFGT